ncbi:MAG: hypothetical protein OXG15_06135 [Gammaproteobacteria bacterium]|nr:hypothetical protein [Gammaproteobacteria bacterium]
MTDPLEILSVVLSEYADSDKWKSAPFEHVRRIPNTLVGSVGQDFVERLCAEYGFECAFPVNAKGVRSKNSPWDIQINGVRFELKTATEDVNGSFQFNHVRYHREYDALLCVGISPANIHFGVWSKAQVATGKAGNLVSMEKSGSASHKLTKRPDGLHSIGKFPKILTEFLRDF